MSEVKAAFRPPLAAPLIFVRYVLSAIVSGLSNLASQEIVVRALPIAPIMISLLIGTGVGFFLKYFLDKRWVFLDGYDNHVAEIRKISVYGAFGIGTTLLFCLIELSFWHIWQTMEAKYVGATIGLLVGNWIKYLLDKHYVFPRTDCARDQLCGAGPYERSQALQDTRADSYGQTLQTGAEDVNLKKLKLRRQTFETAIIDPGPGAKPVAQITATQTSR